ncbi:hypothetical protein [Streptoalloteichus hindustanus]|nr:hypothetical protein [Streptoalloteichus hindustanus]
MVVEHPLAVLGCAGLALVVTVLAAGWELRRPSAKAVTVGGSA